MKDKNLNIFRIAFRNISKQRFQTTILLLVLFITTISLFFSDYLTKSMQEGIRETKERLGADLIVVPDRFVSSIEDALFLGKPCTVNFEKEWLDKIAHSKGVKQVGYQLYISSLSSDCCDSSLQLIALDMNTDFVVAPWLSKDGIRTIAKDEIILGRNMQKKVGDIVTYFNRKFTVIDVLQETGMGYDSCAFISYETAYDIANDQMYKSILPFKKDEEVISMVLVKAEEGQNISEVRDNIIKQYGVNNIAVYQTSELVNRFVDALSNFVVYGKILKILFLILAVVSLYGIYSITIHLRKAEFGTFFSFGTRKKTIVAILIAEMLMIVIVSTLVGIGLVCLFVIPFHQMLKETFSIPYLMPNVNEIVWMGIKTFLINILVCFLASVKAFYELAHLDGISLIKANNE